MDFNEPPWVATDPGKHAIFAELRSFVDEASAEPAESQTLARSTVEALCSLGAREPSNEDYRQESRVLFGVLCTMVKQLDAAAPQQDYMVTLVLSLRDVPVPATAMQGFDYPDEHKDMNRELLCLKNVWADFDQDAPLHPRLEDRSIYPRAREGSPWRLEQFRSLSGQEWTNLNAFVARLHVAAPDLWHWDLRGLYAMIEALEQPLSSSRLDDVLPAAASWIIYAGEQLKSNDVPYAYYPDDGGAKRYPWSKGELWHGPHAFNSARWEFWMQRFKEISGREDVSDEVRAAASAAFEAGSG